MNGRLEDIGFERYPDGREWRCGEPGCTFTTDDDGPDRCPEHGRPMTRTLARRDSEQAD